MALFEPRQIILVMANLRYPAKIISADSQIQSDIKILKIHIKLIAYLIHYVDTLRFPTLGDATILPIRD